MKTREELAAMTDDEVLAYEREKHGNPYMPLSVAKKMRHADLKWWHQGVAWKQAQRLARDEAERELREKVFGNKDG